MKKPADKKSGLLTALEMPTTSKAPEAAKAKPADPSGKELKSVLFRLSTADWRRMKQIAIDRDSSMQQLIEDGINTLLRERGLQELNGKK